MIKCQRWLFTRQPHKMVKHTQTICRQQATSCLSVCGHFVGLTLEGLTHFRPNVPFLLPENIRKLSL